MQKACKQCYWSRAEGYKPCKVWCVIKSTMTAANKQRPNCKQFKRDLSK